MLTQIAPPSETESMILDLGIIAVLVAAIITGLLYYRNRNRR